MTYRRLPFIDCTRCGGEHPQPYVRASFWARVCKVSHGCWEWVGAILDSGYGKAEGGRAHRVSYAMSVAPIPNGLDVLHRCDNRKCVKPEHLFLGTNTDNMRDMAAKGRGRLSRLTQAQVREIRHRYATGTVSMAALGREFGCDSGHICRIVNHESRRLVS